MLSTTELSYIQEQTAGAFDTINLPDHKLRTAILFPYKTGLLYTWSPSISISDLNSPLYHVFDSSYKFLYSSSAINDWLFVRSIDTSWVPKFSHGDYIIVDFEDDFVNPILLWVVDKLNTQESLSFIKDYQAKVKRERTELKTDQVSLYADLSNLSFDKTVPLKFYFLPIKFSLEMSLNSIISHPLTEINYLEYGLNYSDILVLYPKRNGYIVIKIWENGNENYLKLSNSNNELEVVSSYGEINYVTVFI